jgi:hypothetical protein
VVDVGGAINHGDHGLQPVSGLHLAAERKLGALFHEEKKALLSSSLQSEQYSTIGESTARLSVIDLL